MGTLTLSLLSSAKSIISCLSFVLKYALFPKNKVRFVNVSELTALGVGDESVQSDDTLLDSYFTTNRGVVFNFHGYPQTIKKLLFDYSGASRIKVNGYIEEGSTTTPFDMETRNRTSRLHLVLDMTDVLYRQKNIQKKTYDEVVKEIKKRLESHKQYILEHGDDPIDITDWMPASEKKK